MFFGLVERITGYGGVDGRRAAGNISRMQTLQRSGAEIPQAEEVTVVKHTEIRGRSGGADPPVSVVSQGSKPQVTVGSI
ncbi:hypothetical protein HU200_057730 [Digitaria exilis]|uniref:Uncharacterized protein n=1 Tax=Digitaria exilis TaxID=1010633 RepID=A0A835AGE1_9POAL|nr:hypothetical protein HU200_057730 [Digitaria exilis]